MKREKFSLRYSRKEGMMRSHLMNLLVLRNSDVRSLTRGLFGCEILFHDACAVRQFGMRDEVRHSAPPRV